MLIICASGKSIIHSDNGQHDNYDDKIKIHLAPDTSFLLKVVGLGLDSESTITDFNQESDKPFIIPLNKRNIPIELQKALFAHGIVG